MATVSCSVLQVGVPDASLQQLSVAAACWHKTACSPTLALGNWMLTYMVPITGPRGVVEDAVVTTRSPACGCEAPTATAVNNATAAAAKSTKASELLAIYSRLMPALHRCQAD